MHSHHITVRNIVTWNDAGSALEIGHTSQADLLEDVVFENIEAIRIIDGMCHIYLIDHSEVRNVRYENIYVEGNIPQIPEINFTISKNFYSTDETRGQIHHILLKNLHVETAFQGARLCGFDEEHRIQDIIVDGIYMHSGTQIEKFQSELPYRKLEFADKIKMEE